MVEMAWSLQKYEIEIEIWKKKNKNKNKTPYPYISAAINPFTNPNHPQSNKIQQGEVKKNAVSPITS